MIKDILQTSKFYNTTHVHNADFICHFCHKTHVMCNQDNGLSFIYLKGFEQFHNLCLNGYIQCSCRFIADDQFRITDHGNGNYHTLLHATGELMRIAVNTLFRVRDSQFAEHFQNFFSCFCFFHSFVML